MTELQKYIQTNMPQLAKEFLPDARGWTNRFPIKSETSNRQYTVAQRMSDGAWGCSCPGWIRNRWCKHLTNIMPSINKAEDALGIRKSLNAGQVKKTTDKSNDIVVVNKTVYTPPKNVPRIPGMAIKPSKGPAIPSTAVAKPTTTGIAKVKKPFVDLSKYKTYDTSTGYGSPEQWRSAFEERMNYKVFTPVERKEKSKGLCDVLYEAKSYEALRDTYYDLIKKHHPDIAGDTDINRTNSQLLNDTYLELKKNFGKK